MARRCCATLSNPTNACTAGSRVTHFLAAPLKLFQKPSRYVLHAFQNHSKFILVWFCFVLFCLFVLPFISPPSPTFPFRRSKNTHTHTPCSFLSSLASFNDCVFSLCVDGLAARCSRKSWWNKWLHRQKGPRLPPPQVQQGVRKPCAIRKKTQFYLESFLVCENALIKTCKNPQTRPPTHRLIPKYVLSATQSAIWTSLGLAHIRFFVGFF
jgi:hypothetical protein